MGQILHGTATTTHAIRAKIQNAKESLGTLASRYNVNIKTVQKWKGRSDVSDQACGCASGQGSVISELEQMVIVTTRRKTLLPLDDLFDLLKPIIPTLTRSNLHRCLQRHNISKLSDLLSADEPSSRKTFKTYRPGYLHVDTTEIHLRGEKWCTCLWRLTVPHVTSISNCTTTSGWRRPLLF